MLIGKNKLKMCKKALCLIFAFLLSIESMAAVVSDNDGAAFVTKAEFEALKNNFVDQITNYSTSIDQKIDGAIASYLAGLNTDVMLENYWEKLMENTNNNFWWMNNWETGTEVLTPNVVANIVRDLYIESFQARGYGWWPSAWNTNGSIVNMRHWIWGQNGETNFDFTDKYNWSTRTDTMTSTGSSNNITKGKDKTNQEQNISTVIVTGVGSRWIAHTQPNGEVVIRSFAKAFYPIIFIDVWDHIYYNLRDNTSAATITKSYYSDGARSYKVKGSGTVPTFTSFGTINNGVTKQTGTSKTSSNYIEARLLLAQDSDGINYENKMIWGSNVGTNVYYSLDTAQPYKETSAGDKVLSTAQTQFNDLYHTATAEKVQKNYIYGYDLTYNYYNITYNTAPLSSFQNAVASNTAGEVIRLAQGVKIAENQNEEATYEFRIKFKSNPNTGTVTYIISDKKFNEDGSLAAGASTISSGTVNVGQEVSFEALVPSKQQFWINLKSDTNNSIATIDEFNIKAK